MCLAARTGVCAAFNIVYAGHRDVFTIQTYGVTMSWCNFIARVFVIIAPMVSEQEGDLPLLIYTTVCACGILISALLSPINI